jgi:threonine dehydrogenase-like Zn-dependent dehydrogenase
MRAVVVNNAGDLEVASVPDPAVSPLDAIVRVERCGICGSDLHLLSTGWVSAGCILGHEICGTVAAVGAEVTSVREGDRVVVFPCRRCGHCAACLRGGSVMLCDEGPVGWLGASYPGGYAEYVATPADTLRKIPDEMGWDVASLVEPYTVAVHARERSLIGSRGAKSVDGVGIVGGGPIGLMVLAALRAAGVENIVVGEPKERRAEVARSLGATAAGPSLEAALGDGPLPEVVFDCTGIPAGPGLALASTRKGGETVLAAMALEGDMAVPGTTFFVNEGSIIVSAAYTEAEFDTAIDELAGPTGRDLTTVISGSIPLGEVSQTFVALTKPDAPVKCQVAPWE